MINLKKILILLFSLLMVNAFADTTGNDDLPWGVMVYRGELIETNLGDVYKLNYQTGAPIYTIEVSHELSPNNLLRKYFQPFISTLSLTGEAGYIDDPAGSIYEINPYLLFRWEHFPWDRFIVNTYAIGWGVSYDSRVSTWEQHDSSNTKRLLDFLAFETTLALPKYPEWQLVLRLHHRSGAFGLYGADNAGSNFLGVGIRYNF